MTPTHWNESVAPAPDLDLSGPVDRYDAPSLAGWAWAGLLLLLAFLAAYVLWGAVALWWAGGAGGGFALAGRAKR